MFLCVAVCNLTVDFQSDSDSFNPTLWEEQRQQRMTVAFEFEEKKEEEENAGKVKVSSVSFNLVFTCYGQGPIYRSGVELFLCSTYTESTCHHVASRAVEEEQRICYP